MPKDIKKRERQEKFIRKLDKNAIYTSKIKRNFQNSYRKISEKKNEEKESENPTNYASSNIVKNGKENIKLTGYLSYDVSKIAYKKIKSRLEENNTKKSARTTQSEQINKKLVNAKSDSKTVPNEKIIKKPNNKSETLSNAKKQINNKIKNIAKELGKKIIKRSKKYRLVACNKWWSGINHHNNSYNCFNIWLSTRFFIFK